jgi:hypothetical protein
MTSEESTTMETTKRRLGGKQLARRIVHEGQVCNFRDAYAAGQGCEVRGDFASDEAYEAAAHAHGIDSAWNFLVDALPYVEWTKNAVSDALSILGA